MSKPISKGNVSYLKQISEEFLIKVYQGNIQSWNLRKCNQRSYAEQVYCVLYGFLKKQHQPELFNFLSFFHSVIFHFQPSCHYSIHPNTQTIWNSEKWLTLVFGWEHNVNVFIYFCSVLFTVIEIFDLSLQCQFSLLYSSVSYSQLYCWC